MSELMASNGKESPMDDDQLDSDTPAEMQDDTATTAKQGVIAGNYEGQHYPTSDVAVDVCKHCGLTITGSGWKGMWVHAEGLQFGLHRCALEPYGYDAAPSTEPCGLACNGWQDQ